MARKLKEYSPTEYLDFSKPRIRKEQEEALAKVRRKFGKEYPLVVGGKKVMTSYVVPSVNPANPKEIVGRFAHASKSHAEDAIQVAAKTFEKKHKKKKDKRDARVADEA